MTLVHRDDSARVVVAGTGTDELFLVATVQPGASAERSADTIYSVLGQQLEQNEADVVQERIFGTVSVLAAVLDARRHALPRLARAPSSYVEGAPPWGEGLAGVMVHAVTNEGTPSGVETLWNVSSPVGRRWTRDGTEHLLLQGLDGLTEGDALQVSAESEFDRLFDSIERSLGTYGATLNDIVRTWFYLDDIVPVYQTFNRVRSARYAARGLIGHGLDAEVLPASTGIGGRNARGARAMADVLAVRGSSGTAPRRLASHSQLEPMRYGSSFARGAVLSARDTAVLHVSGTAAIGADGQSLHPGNAAAQIESTMDHVASLLASACGATLADVAAATAFVKRPEYGDALEKELRLRGLDAFPAVVVVADVCREELLFELDAEALVRKGP